MQTYVKKLAASLLVGGMAVLVPALGHAFSSQLVNTSTAQVTVGGGQVAMSVSIRNVADNAVATQIGWTANAGDQWKQANQYLLIASTLSVAGSGIQTYTDNKGPGASPLYSGSTTTASGLVNTVDTTKSIPTAWQIVAQAASPVAPDNPDCNGAVTQPPSCLGGPQTGYAWFYHKDKAHQDFANEFFYIVMEKAGVPPQIQFSQNSFGAGSANGVNKVYLEANFQGALAGSTYRTNKLTVELYNP